MKISTALADYPYALARCHFESDAEWANSPMVPKLLAGYDHASRMASLFAKWALTDDEQRITAHRWDAAATALEAALALYDYTDDEGNYQRDNSMDLTGIIP